MCTVVAWMKSLDADATAGAKFIASLKRKKIVLVEEKCELGTPGLVLVSAVGDEIVEEISRCVSQCGGPVLVIALRRSSLGNGGSWRLVQAGASDVFVIEECSDPAEAVFARLQRITEVEELVNSSLVKENLIGESRSWREVIRQAVELARFSTGSLLVTGESGTGKEMIARLVHTLDARPAKGKLVVLDCTTIVPALSGSEFFGHERGAFTNAVAPRDGAFALAHQGSLFLDEVGELSLSLQAELLRIVQERTYKRVGSNTWQQADFRLVCATNRDLQAEEAKGNFRLDFFHRIASARCHLPPLRERREDILPLARYFLRQAVKDPPELDFAPEVQELLITRDYPGNIRELRQLVLRIAHRHAGPGPVTVGAVPPDDRLAAVSLLKRDWRDEPFQNAIRRALAGGAGLQEIKDQTVETAIEIALRDVMGNNQRAAAKLGVTDRALQMRRASRRGGVDNTAERVSSPDSRVLPMDHETHPESA
jgi:transcriptional regulator with GAF, ATPase, and Fis domain